MKKTPLYDWHIAHGARMAPFGGWDMPIQYSSIIEEHTHTREKAGLFDTCHMGEFYIHGPHACDDINALVTSRIDTLKPGRCRYGFLLNQNGGVIDDLIVYRQSDDTFMIVVNAGTCENDAAWIQKHLSEDTRFENHSDVLAKIDIQGPVSTQVLQPFTKVDLSALPYFGFATGPVLGTPAVISRTGYTGERGYEIYIATNKALPLWEKLVAHEDVIPAGLGARDTLRLEAGLPLYGHELTDDRTPVGSGFSFAVSMKKEYIGKSVVEKEKNEGAPQMLCGLKCEGRRSPREGHTVLIDGAEAGKVTSGSFAPTLGCAIAMAYIDAAKAETGTACEIDTGRAKINATIVDMPFYTGTARE